VTGPAQVSSAPSGRKLATATGVSVLVAALLLVTVILPAEYGMDPVGTGRALGLAELSRPAATPPAAGGPVSPQLSAFKTDSREFKIGPYEFLEFKYELAKGATMLYDWKATAPVTFNFHADPAGQPKDASKSFENGDAAGKSGAYMAPFDGIHGWYWENTGGDEVTVRLSTAGFYQSAKEFHHDGKSLSVALGMGTSAK
jgi:hypothetical protein